VSDTTGDAMKYKKLILKSSSHTFPFFSRIVSPVRLPESKYSVAKQG